MTTLFLGKTECHPPSKESNFSCKDKTRTTTTSLHQGVDWWWNSIVREDSGNNKSCIHAKVPYQNCDYAWFQLTSINHDDGSTILRVLVNPHEVAHR